MGDRNTKGDLYDNIVPKIATAGQNGQFRTPRHIIATIVELVEPKPEDVICDPAVGTCGFLVAAGEYLRKHRPDLFRDEKLREFFQVAYWLVRPHSRPCKPAAAAAVLVV